MSSSTDTFAGEKDIYLFRLRKMEALVVRFAMHLVLIWGTSLRDPAQNFLDYLTTKNSDDVEKSRGQFKKRLSQKQIPPIMTDLSGQSYDTTLLYMCIMYTCDGLASLNDDKWKLGNYSLESLITSAKEFRNEISHELPDITKSGFTVRTENLRKVLKDMLTNARAFYKVGVDVLNDMHCKVDKLINTIRDMSLVPQTFADYQKLPLFSELRDYMKNKGIAELRLLLDGWDFVSPISTMADVKFKVNTVYTDMLIKNKKGSKKNVLLYEDILNEIKHDNSDSVILVEGIAGGGKSTLMKKIFGEWVSGLGSLKGLKDFDFLFFFECRNNSLSSFTELVKAMITEVAKSFMENELAFTVFSLQTLIIIDGLDELNATSLILFKVLMDLKKQHGNLTLLVTTRPEKVETYYSIVTTLGINTKHIHLNGIPESKREEYVIKYHDEMEKTSSCCRDTDGLLQYLKRTKNRLDHLWRLPFNLTLLCIMWNNNPELVNSITTAPELYWQIHLASVNKLKVRLRHNYLGILSELQLTEKVDYFVFGLCKEALTGLQQEEINLSDEAVKRLFNISIHKGLPVDEMNSAFLKKTVMTTVPDYKDRFTFTHKGIQDFLSALYLWKMLQGKNSSFDIEEIAKSIMSILDSKAVPTDISQSIMVYIDGRLRSLTAIPSVIDTAIENPHDDNIIRNLLTNGESSQALSKFQNVLIILIGLFYVESKGIKDDKKAEVLNLLEESGISGRNEWLNVLNAVNSDDFVIKFVSKVPGIMEGLVEIENDNVFAYASLFRVSSPSEVRLNVTGDPKDIPCMKELLILINSKEIKVKGVEISDDNVQELSVCMANADFRRANINLSTDFSSMSHLNNFLQNISKREAVVTRLFLHHYLRNPSSSMPFESAFNEILVRCKVEQYVGPVTDSTQLPTNLNSITASVASAMAYEKLLAVVKITPSLTELKVCFDLSVSSSLFEPLPDKGMLPPTLYIPDVSDDTSIEAAIDLVQRLRPNAKRNFYRVSFPRATVSGSQQMKLLQGLKGIDVSMAGGIFLPSSCCPSDDQKELLQNFVAVEIKSTIKWQNKDCMWSS